MKVKDIMRKPARFCDLDTPVDTAVELMHKNACGCLPVIGEGGNVLGIITDRDICIALGTRDKKASQLLVKEVVPLRLFTCTADDDIHTALTTFQSERVRRLPVIDQEGVLQGVLCLDDLALKAKRNARKGDLTYADVVTTFKAICEPLFPVDGKTASAA